MILEKEVSLVQVKAGFTFLNKLKEKEKKFPHFRYHDGPRKNEKVNNLLQYSTLSCPAQRTNYTHEDGDNKIFHENYADDEDELYPRTSSAMNMNPRKEMIKDNNIKVCTLLQN